MLLLIADSNSAALRDMLLQACSVNEVYDRQCEDSRVIYLHRLITASGAHGLFYETLLNKLNSATGNLQTGLTEEQLGWAQIFAILCMMAAKEEHFAREDLYAFFDKSSEDLVELCLWPLVLLDGVSGLLRCVRRIHNKILTDYDQNGWIFENLVQEFVERNGAETAAIELQKARREVIELDRLIVLKDAVRPEVAAREIIDYATFKRKLDATGTAWGGRNFTKVELLAAANDLLNEHEPATILS